MKTSIEQIEKSMITVICPSQGAIIVINTAFSSKQIATYRKENGNYKKDREMDYNEAAKAPLIAMIAAHNNSIENQKEANDFM